MDLENLRKALKIMEMLIVDCIIFFLAIALLYSMHNSEMQKREWCYNYLTSADCMCMKDTGQLLNRSISFPQEVKTDFPDSNISILNIEKR